MHSANLKSSLCLGELEAGDAIFVSALGSLLDLGISGQCKSAMLIRLVFQSPGRFVPGASTECLEGVLGALEI